MVGEREPMDQALQQALDRHGLFVEVVATSHLIDSVNMTAPDAILLVGDAAHEQGKRAIAVLAGDPGAKSVPVIVLSSATDLGSRMDAFRHGAMAVVPREASADAIAKRVTELARDLSTHFERNTGEIGEANFEELVELVKKELRSGILSVHAPGHRGGPMRVVLGAGRPVADAVTEFVARLKPHVTAANPMYYQFHASAGGQVGLLELSEDGDVESFAHLRVLLVDDDPARADALAQELRARGALVFVTDTEGRGLPRAIGLDPQVAIIDAKGLEGQGFEVVRAIRKDPRLRWASILVAPWADIWPESSLIPDLAQLASRVEPLLASERDLAHRVLEGTPFDTRLEATGPSRMLRTLVASGKTVHMTVRSPKATVEVDVAENLVVGARAKLPDGTLPEGSLALTTLLSMSSGRVHVEHRTNPSVANVMAPVEEALSVACAELPAAPSGRPVPGAAVARPRKAGPPPPPPRPGWGATTTSRRGRGLSGRPIRRTSPQELTAVGAEDEDDRSTVTREPPDPRLLAEAGAADDRATVRPASESARKPRRMSTLVFGVEAVTPATASKRGALSTTARAPDHTGSAPTVPAPPLTPSELDDRPPPVDLAELVREASQEDDFVEATVLRIDSATPPAPEPAPPEAPASEAPASEVPASEAPAARPPVAAPPVPATAIVASPALAAPHRPAPSPVAVPDLARPPRPERPARPSAARTVAKVVVGLSSVVFLLVSSLITYRHSEVRHPDVDRLLARLGVGRAEVVAEDPAAIAEPPATRWAGEASPRAEVEPPPVEEPPIEEPVESPPIEEAVEHPPAEIEEAVEQPPEEVSPPVEEVEAEADGASAPTSEELVERADRAGTSDLAELLYRRALQRDPSNHHAMVGLGRLLIARGRHAEAVEPLRGAVRRRSRRAAYRVWLGDALAGRGDAAGARREWVTALELEPDNRQAQQRLGQ